MLNFVCLAIAITLVIGNCVRTNDYRGYSPANPIGMLVRSSALHACRHLWELSSSHAQDMISSKEHAPLSIYEDTLRYVCKLGISDPSVALPSQTRGVFAPRHAASVREPHLGAIAEEPYPPSLPRNLERQESMSVWCDCGTGVQVLSVGPKNNQSQATRWRRGVGDHKWIAWHQPVSEVTWQCDGMPQAQNLRFDSTATYWSVKHTTAVNGFWPLCGKITGLLEFVSWKRAAQQTSIPFTSSEGIYDYFTRPMLLRTSMGSLLAFAEAKRGSCEHVASSDLVLKRSVDGGATWSDLGSARGEWHAVAMTIAPAQLSLYARTHPLRILLPHVRNTTDAWLSYSDDDGYTWSHSRLLTQRVHPSFPRGHENVRGPPMSDFVYDSVLLSNSDGDTWYSVDAGNADSAIGVDLNERWITQLDNGSVQINLHRSSAHFAEVQYSAKTCAGNDGDTLSCRTGREVRAKLAFSGPNSFEAA